MLRGIVNMENFVSYWSWIWIIAGVVMILAEFVIPGFVICFFGLGAIITGIFSALFQALPLVWQIVLFIVSGVCFALIGRKIFHGNTAAQHLDVDADDFAGECAIVTGEISPGHPGKVEFRGSYWTAVSEKELAVGMQVKIVKRENLTLTVSEL